MRRRAISDARSCVLSCSRIALCLIARSARYDVRLVAAVFVGADGTEKRCSGISSCRSAREHRESAVTDARSCLAARLQKHFGNGAVRRVDVALIEPDQIPDRILEDASQGPASGACAVQFEDTCHEIETAQ